jgi:hypothetical protein
MGGTYSPYLMILIVIGDDLVLRYAPSPSHLNLIRLRSKRGQS